MKQNELSMQNNLCDVNVLDMDKNLILLYVLIIINNLQNNNGLFY